MENEEKTRRRRRRCVFLLAADEARHARHPRRALAHGAQRVRAGAGGTRRVTGRLAADEARHALRADEE